MVAVRPEKIRLRELNGSGDARGENELRGTIDFVSYLGPITEYAIRVDDGPVVLVRQQNESAAARANLIVGRPIALDLSPENCMLFRQPPAET